VGWTDDSLWSIWTTSLGPTRVAASVLVIVTVPLLALFGRGFDWEAVLYATPVVVLVLALAQRRWLVPVVTSVVLCSGLFVAVEAWNVLDYQTWGLDGPPALQVSWCGQDFFLESTATAGQGLLPRDHVSEVLVTPSGTAIYARGGCPPTRTGSANFVYAYTTSGVLTYSTGA
jgi:hypothetical protein